MSATKTQSEKSFHAITAIFLQRALITNAFWKMLAAHETDEAAKAHFSDLSAKAASLIDTAKLLFPDAARLALDLFEPEQTQARGEKEPPLTIMYKHPIIRLDRESGDFVVAGAWADPRDWSISSLAADECAIKVDGEALMIALQDALSEGEKEETHEEDSDS
jgi:hypothetical protein